MKTFCLVSIMFLLHNCATVQYKEEPTPEITIQPVEGGCISNRYLGWEDEVKKMSKIDLDTFLGAIKQCNRRYGKCLLQFNIVGFQRYTVLCGE